MIAIIFSLTTGLLLGVIIGYVIGRKEARPVSKPQKELPAKTIRMDNTTPLPNPQRSGEFNTYGEYTPFRHRKASE